MKTVREIEIEELIFKARLAGQPLGHLPDIPQNVLNKLVARGEAIDLLINSLVESELALKMIRDAWNIHFSTCTHEKIEMPIPSIDDIQSWINAPSNTASAHPTPSFADPRDCE